MAEGAKRILVLEHDRDSAVMMEMSFQGEGYKADSLLLSEDVGHFVEEVRRRTPDLVTVDISPTNPEQGYQLLDALRADPVAQRVPVLAVTTDEPLSEAAIASYNVKATLTKSYEMDRLLEKVREAVGFPPLHARVPLAVRPPMPVLEQAKEILDRYSREALLRWVERLRQESPWKGRGDLGLGEILGHIPVLVEAVSVALEYGDPEEFFQRHPDAAERVYTHAADRRAKGIPLASLLREYSLLRDEIWAAIGRHFSGPVQPSDLYPLQQAISGTLDRITETTVPAYLGAEEKRAA